MKKLQLFIIVSTCIVLVFNTKCFSQTEVVQENKEVNYIPYFIEVQKAKRLYDKGKLKQAYMKVDSLFNFFEPKESLFMYESSMYCELSDTLKIYNKSRLKKLITLITGKYGKNLSDYDRFGKKWKRIILKAGLTEKEIKSIYNNLQKNINTAIRDTIGVMYERDQWARETQERIDTKLDSIDRLNEPLLIDIITKYGYPKETLVGAKLYENPARDGNIQVLLLHMQPYVKIKFIEPILKQELKNGDVSPWIYATILDYIIKINQVDSPFPYYGSYYTNVSTDDIEEINKNRLSIGMLGIKQNF
jgi:hypothetical protein